MKNFKIGLLPLYIKLYDDSSPNMREKIDAFHEKVSEHFKKRKIDVINVPVCRIKSEFEEAIKTFEDENADAIVTLHLAYSPSLESSDALASSKLPIIVLDTTPDYIYNSETQTSALSYNHGIHGVQDMCNLLIRNGKPFAIFAGHIENSNVMQRLERALYAAKLARNMQNARVGIVGGQFEGMGDFGIPFDVLKNTIGFDVISYDTESKTDVAEEEIIEEYEDDIQNYINTGVTYDLYKKSASVGMAIRKWINDNNLTAFSMNFLNTSVSCEGFSCMPFIEASKAMARNIGYAGEGDVMTAALVGSLMSVFKSVSFCEMFCPDWEGETVFLNHMGEFNLNCSSGELKLQPMSFQYTDAGDTAFISGSFMSGKAVFVCLAPLICNSENSNNKKYRLIAAKGKMLDSYPKNGSEQSDRINGWFKPEVKLHKFLEKYSKYGGIHHAAMVWDGDMKILKYFAEFMNWDFISLDK